MKTTTRQANALANKLRLLSGVNVFENSRRNELIETRALLNYILYNYKKFTLYEIRDFYRDNGKNYDHATALHSIRNYELYKRYNKNYEDWMAKIVDDVEDSVIVRAKIEEKLNDMTLEDLKDVLELANRLDRKLI